MTISELFNSVGTVFDVINYTINAIIFLIQIIINPYLFLLIVFTIAH